MNSKKINILCDVCSEYNEVITSAKSMECEVCGATLIADKENTKVSFEEETFDDFEDIPDLDELEDFEEIENIDKLDDGSIDMNIPSYNEFSNKDILSLAKQRDAFKLTNYLTNYDTELSYSSIIKSIEITPLNISNSLYDYKIIEPKLLLARMIYFMKKARRDGVLILEKELEVEPNPILRFAVSHALAGLEPDTVLQIMKIKQEWFRKKYLQYSLSQKKVTFIDRVMKDFDFIIDGVMKLQGGYTARDLYENCREFNNTFNIKFKNFEDFEQSHKNYLEYNDPYFLLDTEKAKDSKDLLLIFNKKRDALQDIEMYVLEDVNDLGNRLLLYSSIARDDGIVAALFNASLQDPNILIRHVFQKILLGDYANDINEYIDKYKEKSIMDAKQYHNDDFILLYEREINMIQCLCLGIIACDSPELQKFRIVGFCPEIINFHFLDKK
jgi:hypothetical protein